MVAECRAFRDLAKEVMNSELEGVQFGQKGMGKCMRKVKKSCSNAKMHFPRQEQHVISLEKAKMRLVVSFRCLCCLDHKTSSIYIENNTSMTDIAPKAISGWMDKLGGWIKLKITFCADFTFWHFLKVCIR